MDWKIILDWIFLIVTIAAFIAVLYFKSKGDIHSMTCELIAIAESTGLPGVEKMNNVVSVLYDHVPTFLKKIFTKESLQAYAQRVFDWMRTYANFYLEKQSEKDILEKGENQSVAIEVEDGERIHD